MLIAVVLMAAVAACALLLAYKQQKAHQQAHVDWALERRELINRIQHPEILPLGREPEPYEIPERQPDEWAKVGEITIDPEYGLSDDDG